MVMALHGFLSSLGGVYVMAMFIPLHSFSGLPSSSLRNSLRSDAELVSNITQDLLAGWDANLRRNIFPPCLLRCA